MWRRFGRGASGEAGDEELVSGLLRVHTLILEKGSSSSPAVGTSKH